MFGSLTIVNLNKEMACLPVGRQVVIFFTQVISFVEGFSRLSKNKPTSIRVFILTLLFLLISSCNRVPTENDDNILVFSDELIPMGLGNTWVYLDSIWNDEFDSLAYVAYDTITIFDTSATMEGIFWYRTWRILPGLGMQFRNSNDSIFSYDYGFDGLFENLKFIPPQDTLQSYDTFYALGQYERTVEYLNEPFTTELGTFDSCVVYKGNNISFSEEYIVAPGIGVIKSYSPSYLISFPYKTSTLVEYDLVID